MSGTDPEEKKLEAAARLQPSSPTPEKLEKFYVDHHAQVLRAAYRITGNASDAEDVLQTVFLRLLRAERGDALSETPGSYLHRAAVNAALDLMRTRRTWKPTSIDELSEELSEDSGGDPESRQIDRQTRERVREVLAEMSPKMAEIFALRYFEGFDNHEIARMLRTSKSTVAVLLHRARHRLKKEVSKIPGESR